LYAFQCKSIMTSSCTASSARKSLHCTFPPPFTLPNTSFFLLFLLSLFLSFVLFDSKKGCRSSSTPTHCGSQGWINWSSRGRDRECSSRV
jgi:hypothetical protein